MISANGSETGPVSVAGPPPSASVGQGIVEAQPQRSWGWRPWAFRLVNVWLVIHLTAIITAPATVGPSSQTSRNIWEIVAPYLQGLYLNHGFHYFAPQPGSSNLVSWSLNRKDGTTLSGRFPSFEIMPRLNYHRHFMLSEFLGNSPPELQAVIVKGFARNLCREYDGESVTISTVRHDLPSMERVRAGGRLNDGDLYEEQPLGTFRRDEL